MMIPALLAAAVLRGPFPLLNTPWTEEAKLDIPVLVREAEYVNGCGTGGIIWPTAPEIKDLDAAGEYEAGLFALAERSVRPGAAFTAQLTATCAGTNATAGLACARKIESIAKRTGAKLAILARPPDNATNQTMIASYYRELAKVTTQTVVIQTYNGKSPQPDVSLLVELAKEFPEVYGYVKEESPGDKVNDRMAELLTHPEIKGVFSGWGGKGWIYQAARIGTCGVISQRPGYASLFVKVWNRLAAGADASDPELADAYAKYLYMVNLGDIFSKWGDDEMRGPHLYTLKRLGIFRNMLSREGPGKVKEWPMTDQMRAEIDARLRYCGLAYVESPLKIGLYVDDGCRGAGVVRWAEMLDGSPDAELVLLSGEDLRNGGLAGLDLFVSPGGAGGPQTAAMGEKGRAAIRDYVAGGGKYLGTCCGFSNVLNEQPGFAVRNTMMPFRRVKGGSRGGVTARVRFTPEGTNALALCQDDFHIRYHNGPIVEQTEPVPPCSNVVVLATMNCELNEFGAVETPMFGTPACVSADYGKGRMLVYNCHPEINADTRHLVASSIRFLTGRAFRLPASRTAKGCERVGFVAKNLPKAAVTKYLELLHTPNVYVFPLSGEGLKTGMDEICDRIVTP